MCCGGLLGVDNPAVMGVAQGEVRGGVLGELVVRMTCRHGGALGVRPGVVLGA